MTSSWPILLAMQRLIARARSTFDRPWSERSDALRRDLGMLFGRHLPSPVVHASGLARASGTGMVRALEPASFARGAQSLTVTDVVHETRDAVTLVFEPTLAPWTPGQFLTVHVDVGGEVLRRAYSLCTRPGDPRGPAITIKRIPEGRVSTFLVANAHVGMRLEVRGPSGQFVLPPRPDAAASGMDRTPRQVLLIGGGSGITPLVALAEEVLAEGSRATLLYGNRSVADVIFRTRLATLAAASKGRLRVRHVLETAPEDAVSPSAAAAWALACEADDLVCESMAGRLDAALLADLLAELDGPPDAVFSCGPAPMMQAAREALASAGIDPSVVHEERFQSLGEHRATALSTSAQALRITVGGRTTEVLARPGATVLEAGLAAGLAMPFSCMMGGCGACRVKLSGEVVHDTPNGLTAEEAAAGFAFACIARPLGACSVVVASAAGSVRSEVSR